MSKPTTRQQFTAVRRAYRVAHNTPILAEGSIAIRVATTSAMRGFTGHWDVCTPAWASHIFVARPRTARGTSIMRQTVAAACTRWCRATA